jgi:hypothetical protein
MWAVEKTALYLYNPRIDIKLFATQKPTMNSIS